jgi:hypothetical protein
MMLRLAAAVWIAVIAFAICHARSDASHNVYLPLTPGTPLMQQVIKNQSYTYCLDNRASAYPNFRAQLQDVNAQYEERVGIRSREIAVDMPASLSLQEKFNIATAAGCHVIHAMPDVHGCGGTCAAWIGYANSLGAVYVEYKWQLGYTDWRSTHGHELGHGLLGLHEQYQDFGSIVCTRRTDTVMDCGSGVRYPTTLDVTRGCAIILTSWCGKPPPVCTTFPCWDGTLWRMADGWNYSPTKDEWFDSAGASEWCCQASYGGVYNRRLDVWRWLLPSTVWEWKKTDPVWKCVTRCP